VFFTVRAPDFGLSSPAPRCFYCCQQQQVAGASERITWLREDGRGTRVAKADILESVDKSLERLGTDYVDLLQIHWPDR